MENFSYSTTTRYPNENIFELLYISSDEENDDPETDQKKRELEKQERKQRRKQKKLEKKRKKELKKLIENEKKNAKTVVNDGEWQSVSALKALKKLKRQKNESESDNEEIIDGQQKIVLCPSDIVGEIIGKNGCNIKSLKKREPGSSIFYDSDLKGFVIKSKKNDSLLRLEIKLRENIKTTYEEFKKQKKHDKVERKKRRKGGGNSD
jgi:hypothetical protein